MSSAFGPPSSPSTSTSSEMKEDYRQPLQVQSQVSIPVQSHSRVAPNETELVKERVIELKKAFKSGVTKPMEWRLSALRALRTVMVDNETELFAALEADLRKCAFDSWLTEYKNTLNEIDEAIHSLSSWMKPKRVNTNLFNLPGSSHIVSDPLGTVLVISPWNYPFYLAVAPLVGALAAGNSVMIKPSELAPNVSGWIAQTLGPAMSQYGVRVIEGGIPPTEALLKEQWDLIFYTGGGSVGRIILRAAAEHLTPVILELGGKSPAIVTRDANIDVAAKRIAWGKLLNTGQTCVGVDYILCDAAVHDELVNKIGIAIKNMYGANPKQSPDYGRIINTAHTKRLTALVDPLEDGLTVAVGDTKAISFDEKYIPPIVLTGVQSHHRAMRDEIFGPILPIVKVDGAPNAVMREMIHFVNDRPKPLALYVFSGSSATIDSIIANTSSGGVAVNDCVVHLTNPELPFGGVGPSGMGAYHGRKSFEIFSHSKSVLRRSDMSLLDAPQRYPPYSNSNLSFLKSIMWFQGLGLYKPWWYVLSTIILLGVVAILVTKFAADLW